MLSVQVPVRVYHKLRMRAIKRKTLNIVYNDETKRETLTYPMKLEGQYGRPVKT